MNENLNTYVAFLKDHLHVNKPLIIVSDSSNGTTGMVVRELFKNHPYVKAVFINDNPDSEFSAHGPNPLLEGATSQAEEKVKEIHADVGVVFDADGDRAFFIDNKGETLPSYTVSTYLFRHSQPPFVGDELVYQALKHMKLFSDKELIPSRVGSIFVKNTLKSVHGSMAGEFSGHYYYKDFFNADSGIFTLIQVLNALSSSDKSLSEFLENLPKHIVKNDDIKIPGKVWTDIENIINQYCKGKKVTINTKEGLTLDFGDTWLNARMSNTEPLLRLYAGGQSAIETEKLIQDIKSLL